MEPNKSLSSSMAVDSLEDPMTLARPRLGSSQAAFWGLSLPKEDFVQPACTLWWYKTDLWGSGQVKRCVLGSEFGARLEYFRVIGTAVKIYCSLSVTQTMMYPLNILHSWTYCVLCYKARVNKMINSGLYNLFLCHQSPTTGPATTVSAVAPTECTIDCKKRALYIKNISHAGLL